MEPDQIDSGLQHQRRQFGDEIQRFEDNVRDSNAIGRFQLLADIARRRQ